MEREIINNKEYRKVTIHNRTKLIAKDGSAINYYKRNQKATTHLNKDGYPCFGGGVPVHLYVAHGWVDGYFEGAEVNHKDYDRTNFDADNLEWVNHNENIRYSSDVGHYKGRCGCLNPNYGNTVLKERFKNNPSLALQNARPATQNGRATKVSVYKDGEFVKSFSWIGECCQWIKEELKIKADINSIRCTISTAVKNNQVRYGFTYQYNK